MYGKEIKHAKSSSGENEPTLFDWIWDSKQEHVILTGDSVLEVDNFNNEKKYGWLLEPYELKPLGYNYILEHSSKFHVIFTYSEYHLKVINNSILLPLGGCWINKESRRIYEKNKNTSIFVSKKKSKPGRILRHQIINNNYQDVDEYGFRNWVDNKIEGLQDYRFSIVIENVKIDYYFTEKLIDCFITGVIPIYWGCPAIHKFFDIKGMLIFNTIEELEVILKDIEDNGEFIYQSKINSIINNYYISHKYLIADDLIYYYVKGRR